MWAFMRLLIDLLLMPRKWHKRLLHISVPQLLAEIEETSKKATAIKFSPSLVIHLVKYRVRYSILWRRHPCLLGCMLLCYFLCRAGLQVTFHLGCKFENGNLHGHSWISSPQLEKRGRFRNPHGMQEIYCRTLT